MRELRARFTDTRHVSRRATARLGRGGGGGASANARGPHPRGGGAALCWWWRGDLTAAPGSPQRRAAQLVPPPKAAGAGGAPELREGRIRKLEATKFEAKRQQQSQTQIYLSGFVGTARSCFSFLKKSHPKFI